jgi:hypothetical protein
MRKLAKVSKKGQKIFVYLLKRTLTHAQFLFQVMNIDATCLES